ncbi:MAG: acylneuraminate cytidylyltransferase family protein [Methyloceanibacter sp.]
MLAIIPARAGSKGVPGKNKALIGGRPLVDYTVTALECARSVTGIILASDDSDILDRYRDSKTVLAVERPEAIAKDDSTTAEAVSHALEVWQQLGRDIPDTLFVAQPITPLRTAADIDAAYDQFKRAGCESLISACLAEGIRHPSGMYRFKDGRGTPFIAGAEQSTLRQDLEAVYQRNGAIYLVTTEFFRRTGLLRSDNPEIYEMPWERSINIDVPGDLMIAKALIESGALDDEAAR